MKKTIPILPAAADQGDSCSAAEAFALMVLGDSMEPEFHDGEVIVVEADGLAKEGSFVIAEVAGEFTFRQLARAGAGWQLRPLNPAYPPLDLPDLGAVRGVVIQKSVPGRRKATKRYVE